jgi:hypothetical protein
MAGLQGAGKTTATAKLGLHLKEQGRRPLLVGADVYRPAAIDQLMTLGAQIGVEVFSLGTEATPEAIAAAGIAKARQEGFDTVLVDTAGRLQIDTGMMEEMVRIREIAAPDEPDDDSLFSVETLAQPPRAKTPTRGSRGRKLRKVMAVEKTNPTTGWQSLAATTPAFRLHRSFTDAPRSPARIHQSMTPSATERQRTPRAFLGFLECSLSTVSCFVTPS